MDDINFDELDQAVNSAMQPQQPPGVPTDQPVEPSVQALPDEPVSPIVPVVPTKRRGQFMDMVHPSSDMRKLGASAPPIRRQAPIVTPLNPSIVETGLDDETAGTTNTSYNGSRPAADTSFVEPPANDHPWPDPIDMAQTPPLESPAVSEAEMAAVENSFVDSTSDTQVAEPEASEEAPVEPEPESKAEPEPEHAAEDSSVPFETDTMPQSPFVEGAAVEKRPLGAFAAPDGEPIDAEEGLLQDEPVATHEDSAPDTTETPEADMSVTDTTPQPEEVSQTAEVSAKEESQPETEPAEPAVAGPAAPATEVGTAQSIPQQYRPEEVASTDNEEHTVFDTAQYHQPLPLPEKTHSNHKTVFYLFLAVLMLAVGAAAGYVIFVLKLF